MNRLPNEVLTGTLGYLNNRDICSCGLVNRRWRSLSQQDYLWKGLTQRQFESATDLTLSWRSIHRILNRPIYISYYREESGSRKEIGHHRSFESAVDEIFDYHLTNHKQAVPMNYDRPNYDPYSFDETFLTKHPTETELVPRIHQTPIGELPTLIKSNGMVKLYLTELYMYFLSELKDDIVLLDTDEEFEVIRSVPSVTSTPTVLISRLLLQ